MASNGSLMTVPDFPQRVRDLRARGGRMVVLDPRRTETAKVADEHHFVRPGTDAWVLLAMLHVLTAEASPDDLPTVASYVDGLDTVVELVADFTPERAEAVSGLPAGGGPPPRPRARGSGLRRRLQPDRRVRRPVGHRVPVGGDLPQRAHRQPRPPRRRDVHDPGDRRGGHRADRARAPRRLALAGPRAAGDRRRAARGGAARGDRDARRGTGPGPAHRRRQPGAVHARRRPARPRAARTSTSWPPWTSTSTRPPGTPT